MIRAYDEYGNVVELSELKAASYKTGYDEGFMDATDEIHTELITEITMLNETKMTDADLYTFAVRIKEIIDKLGDKRNDI